MRTKKAAVLGTAAFFLINFAYMADMVIIPAADAILLRFSDAPAWLLNFILTGSQLMAVPSALLAPALMRRFRKKRILLFSFHCLRQPVRARRFGVCRCDLVHAGGSLRAVVLLFQRDLSKAPPQGLSALLRAHGSGLCGLLLPGKPGLDPAVHGPAWAGLRA